MPEISNQLQNFTRDSKIVFKIHVRLFAELGEVHQGLSPLTGCSDSSWNALHQFRSIHEKKPVSFLNKIDIKLGLIRTLWILRIQKI